jgi:hypothetical protein
MGRSNARDGLSVECEAILRASAGAGLMKVLPSLCAATNSKRGSSIHIRSWSYGRDSHVRTLPLNAGAAAECSIDGPYQRRRKSAAKNVRFAPFSVTGADFALPRKRTL